MSRGVLAVVFLLGLGLGWSGCDDGDDGGGCPDLSGDWEITAHSCQPTAVGTIMTFSQSGCVINQIEPWPGWDGSINESGEMVWSGPTNPGETMVCDAVLSGDTITSSCDPTCEVTVVRR